MVRQRTAMHHMTIRKRKSLLQIGQYLVRRYFWHMDVCRSSWIAPTALIDRTWPKGVHIGRECIIDHQAVLLTHDLTRGIYFDTIIGDRAFIGARAIIFPGVTIGSGCVVEPGAIVNRNVPDRHRAIGNPAQISPLQDMLAQG
jgi:acetyltransferase-like isoleucine patch superfamily enzyme